MDVLQYASDDEGYQRGNLLDVDELLELLDQLVGDRLMVGSNPNATAGSVKLVAPLNAAFSFRQRSHSTLRCTWTRTSDLPV